MIVLPVVGRELCAESRRPFNYWLRVVGAGALTLVAALTFLPQFAPGATRSLAGASGSISPGLSMIDKVDASVLLE